VAINDVLSLKAARRDAIVYFKCFGAPGHQRPNFDGFSSIRMSKIKYGVDQYGAGPFEQ